MSYSPPPTSLNSAGSVSLQNSGIRRIESNADGIGFYGVTPVPRPPAYAQLYGAWSRTLADYNPYAQSTPYSGIANNWVGPAYASVVNLNDLRSAVENLRLHHQSVTHVVNAIVNDLQAVGIFQ